MADINLGVGGANSAVGGYDIDNSLKLESDNTEYLHKTPTTSGNRQTFTISAWVKRTELGAYMNVFHAGDGDYNQSSRTNLYFLNDDRLRWGGGSAYELTTTQKFRDTSAWYHIVMAVDTTQATSSNRLKLYINGTQVTAFDDETYPTQNFTYAFCKDDKHSVGYNHTDTASYCSMYIAEACLIDGTAYAPTDFGEYDSDTGIWKPIDISGLSFGTNGFYLDFEDSANLGNDASGGTDFTLNNITSADQATDTPTNNFCTLNPLIVYGYPTTISEGATKGVDNSAGLGGAAGTMAVNKGKWYWEFKSSVSTTIMGIQDIEANTSTSNNAHEIPYTMAVYLLGEYNYANDPTGRNDGSTSGLTFDADRRYAVALNLDDDEITYYQLGSSVGTFSLDGLIGLYVRPFASCAGTLQWNFGGYTTMGSYSNTDENGYGTFEYAPPSGYYALCTKNLAEFG